MAEIRLYSGETVKVDDQDFERLSRYRWHRTCKGYAARGPKPGVTIFMHHEVVGRPEPGMQTDHINGDKLDNRRSNLRHCTASLNCVNRYWDRPFRGTWLHKPTGKWVAGFRGKHLGVFHTREEAAQCAAEARMTHLEAFAD